MGTTTRRAAPGISAATELDRAIEVFVRGFALTKSFTHPYVPERHGRAWLMWDAPRRNQKLYRREEWTGHGIDVAEFDRLARRHTRGKFAICPIRSADEPDGPLRAAFRERGYRLATTEPMMIHRLGRIPRSSVDGIRIERVRTLERAAALAKAAGGRQLLPEHLVDDAPLRQYVALEAGTPVGWVQSIVVHPDSGTDGTAGAREAGAVGTADAGHMTWVSNMFVQPAHRRRGIGRALLARMLRDDRRYGASASVLLASHVGARLYPVVGYVQIGELFAYSPPKT